MDGGPQQQSLDVGALLERSGIARLTQLSDSGEVARALEAFAAEAAQLKAPQRVQAQGEAAAALKAAKVPAGARVLAATMRELKAARRTPSAFPVTGEKLPPGVEPTSDLANAYRFVRDHGAEVRHSGERFHSWSGVIWEPGDAPVYRRMMDTAAQLLRYAAVRLEHARDRDEQDGAEELIKHARKSQGEPQIRRAIELAKHLEPIACGDDVWDTHPLLVTCSNGTLDLGTGELRAHSHGDMITRALSVAYDPYAVAPTWERFVAEILPDDDVRAFVQRSAGYSVTGDTSEQCFFVPYGDGSNGKSTYLETMRHVFGPLALEAAGDTFTLSNKGRPTDNKLADLRGVRLVSTSETGEGKRLDEPLLKRISGGDQLTANRVYGDTFRFHATFKLWLVTNHKPEIRGVDLGIWRRVRLVPFTVTIPPEQQDPELPAKLRAEAPGILRWIVDGCRAWREHGLHAPDAVIAATSEWKAEANDVAAFVADECVLADFAKSKAGQLYAAYRQWATSQGCEPLSNKAFGQRLVRLGFKSDRTNAEGRIWRGLGLHAEGHDA